MSLSSNTHLRVVSPRLKCFCTRDDPVAVSNSNTGATAKPMDLASTMSISSHTSVSTCDLRSRDYLYVPFIWTALALHSQSSRKAVKAVNSILTVDLRLLQSSCSKCTRWERAREVKQVPKISHSGCRHV